MNASNWSLTVSFDTWWGRGSQKGTGKHVRLQEHKLVSEMEQRITLFLRTQVVFSEHNFLLKFQEGFHHGYV